MASDTNPDTEPAATELSLDTVFDLLSAHDRRVVLRYLSAHDGWASIDALATHLAVQRHDVDAHAVSDDQHQRAFVRLHHIHLPQLTAAGITEYNAEQGVVTLVEIPQSLAQHLELASGHR